MRTQTTQPRTFVMPIVRKILPPWMAERPLTKRPLTQRELVVASLIPRPDRPRAA